MAKAEVRRAKAFSPVASLDWSKIGDMFKFAGGKAVGGIGAAGSVAKAGATAASGAVYGAGAYVGGAAMHAVLPSQETMRVAFAIILGALIHAIDYWVFAFSNSPARIVVYAVFTIIFAALLFPEAGDERIRTLKAMFWVSFFMILLSGVLVRYLPSIPGDWGLVEFWIGLVFLFIAIARPSTFSKDPYLEGIFKCFLLSAFVLPYLAQGVADQFLNQIPQLAYIIKNYMSALFWPVWLFYAFYVPNYKSVPLRILSIALLLLLLSPLWIDFYRGGQLITDKGGIDAQQTETYLKYLSDMRDTGLLVGKNTRVFFNESWTGSVCGFYKLKDNTFSTAAVTGGTVVSTAPAYCIVKKDGEDVSDSFDTSVESGSLSKAGISLDPIVASQQKFYANLESSFLTLVKAQSFDTTINVNTSCVAKPKSGSTESPRVGRVNKQTFTFASTSNQDLACTIPANTLIAGRSYDVTVDAQFNYVTSAYLRRYFTKPGLLAQFSRSGNQQTAFFSFYQISDTNPSSISTRGPALVGLDVANTVIELSDGRTDSQSFTVRMLIKNVPTWKGKLLSIDSVLLALPKGLAIKEANRAQQNLPEGVTQSNLACTVAGFEGNFEEVAEDDCATALTLAQQSTSNQRFDAGRLTPFAKNLNCRDYTNYIFIPSSKSAQQAVKVDEGMERNQEVYLTCEVAANEPVTLLGNAPYIVKSLRLSAAYTYLISQVKTIRT